MSALRAYPHVATPLCRKQARGAKFRIADMASSLTMLRRFLKRRH